MARGDKTAHPDPSDINVLNTDPSNRRLSLRLQAVADMVTRGSRVCDVGCDHGYVPIYLVGHGISPGAVAMDNKEGPLQRAREHVSRAGLRDYIELRCSDGLSSYRVGEADTLILAGMGGRLVIRILGQDAEKRKDFKELILQPQSEIPSVRRFLRRLGYAITQEDMVLEDGKYYPVIKAVPEGSSFYRGYGCREDLCKGEHPEGGLPGGPGNGISGGRALREGLCDRFGPLLLTKKHPVLAAYLKKEWEKSLELKYKLTLAGSIRAAGRLSALKEEMFLIKKAAEVCGFGLRQEDYMVTITIDGIAKQYPKGTTFEEIARQHQQDQKDMIALVTENGKIRELIKTAQKDCELSFLTVGDDIGHKTYVRTGLMMLVKAVHDVLGGKVSKVKVEFAIGQGYYCNVKMEETLTAGHVEQIKQRMRELTEGNLPITKKAYPIGEAMEIFHRHKMYDKEKLFRYRRGSYVNIYCLDGYYDYYYGYMLPSTGYFKYYDLMLYEKGILLLIPEKGDPTKIDYFEPREKFFKTLATSSQWGEMMGIDSVGDLNDSICGGMMNDMILVQEALQERRIGEIAKEIVDRGNVKFVLIAGPSSSGKTTFSHRLSIQLRTYGLIPHPIALDDYFVDRENTPRDENGNYDFECLEAIDIQKFNEDMNRLLAGERVEMPQFNFKVGKREYHGNFKALGPEDVLVIEGIHGLNPATTASMPDENKFKVYISALTSLNVDEHNRIPTTDGRLLRRLVRDARTRGSSAKRTINMWPSVRRGEEMYIFPFQETADEMFNSVLIYELAVLKQYAEPLLFSIREGEPEYYEAKRLLKFLEYFQGIDSANVPANSICREFIGGSCFKV